MKPPRDLQRQWDAILAKDDLPSDASLRHWTFSGGLDEPDGSNAHCAHRQFIEGEEVSQRQLAGSANAQFWRAVGSAANNLLPGHPRRAFLVRAADSGNVTGSRGRLTQAQALWTWRKFVLGLGLPDPDPHQQALPVRERGRRHRAEIKAPEPEPVDDEPAPAPVRTLTPAEIAATCSGYTPPPKAK